MNKQTGELTRPHVYQFKFGDLIITNMLEGCIVWNDLHPFVATNTEPEQVKLLANEQHLPFPAFEHGFVTTLIQHGDTLIAFDPGFGENAPMPSAGYFNQSLTAAGYSASDVDVVAISHSHPDHIGNLMTAGEPTFPNADIVYGRQEFDYWKRGEHISDMRKPTLALFEKVALPLADRMRFIEPGDTIASGITAVNAFGHSAGHLAFHIEQGADQLMILNDTVAHCVASFAQPGWHFSMDDDADTAAITRRRLLEQVASERIPIIGFHMPFPAIGHVEVHGTGFRYIPALYQFNV